jgi:pantetheine-phosphate adenylyltransferase
MVKVAVGGTFDPIHDGHLALLKKAFELGRSGTVVIGLTSNKMARQRTRPVNNFEVRLKNLRKVLKREFKAENFEVEELWDDYGSAIADDYDFIVVSPETEPVAWKINDIRRERGIPPISIVCVDYRMAEDRFPISSTRVASGEIDVHGRLLARN